MAINPEVLNEVNKHDLNLFKRLDASHYGVFWAIEYLEQNALKEMAARLKQIVVNGNVRMGPLDGFVAAGLTLPAGDFILLSDQYLEYTTDIEIMASLVAEIGSIAHFGSSEEDNDMRSQKSIIRMKQRLSEPVGNSILSKAVQKSEGKVQGQGALIDILLEENLITQEQLNDAREKQVGAKKQLQELLVEMGFISDARLVQVVSKICGMPVFPMNDIKNDPEVLKLIKPDLMRRYSVYPVKIENNHLVLAMINPRDLRALDELGMVLEIPIKPVLVSLGAIRKCLDGGDDSDENVNTLMDNIAEVVPVQEIKAVAQESAKELVEGMAKTEKEIKPVYKLPPEYQMLLLEDSPTVKLVNLILSDAIKARASDVHIEPREEVIDVRYRIDGDLKNIIQTPIKLHAKIVARVKILSSLDITQNMAPQDGRIQLMIDERKVDFRVSTIPTFYGEKIVIRILDGKAAKVDLSVLGFNDHEKEIFKEAIKHPQGMVLVTGPTGSGKTSTLYAALNYVKNEKTNIVTIEDPIEFLNEGINQTQVNPDRGVTFASGLRSILRQDPNVILLGEIRDKETADIALKASITGHLLLSTLHTNSCVATVTRLADIGMDYYQIASALILIVSQRLVKTICPSCKMEYAPSEDYMKEYADEIGRYKITKFYKGKGCSVCNFTGYKGRIAVFEVLKITESVKNIIAKGAPEEEVYKEAYKYGFKRLIDAGMDKAIEGVTTIEEVVKHLGAVDVKSASTENEVVTPPKDPNRPRRVLLVDDEEDIRKIVAKYLQIGGYEVIQAINGQDAVEKAFKEKPDLIVTDLMMPVMDGLEEIRALRSTMETAVIPIIMLTAKQDKESELAGINAGADDYMTKPFDKDKLLARVGMLLKRESLRHA